MSTYVSHIASIASQRNRMRDLIIKWANINSGSCHVAGLEKMAAVVVEDCAGLGATVERITLPAQNVVAAEGTWHKVPLGPAISMVKRPESRVRVFLGIHADTVYSPENPFQKACETSPGKLNGPGVLDAKGGLAVLLLALETLEKSPWAGNIGWEVLINPDEEIGSPGSAPILAAAARRNHLGLVFEPALPNGNLVSDRKGSGNFTFIVRGRSAHAGRDITTGRNAIAALAEAVVRINAALGRLDAVSVNVGQIEGGTALNVVPALALCRINVRVGSQEQQAQVRSHLEAIAADISGREGFCAQVLGDFHAPPRAADAAMLLWLGRACACGADLGLNISWQGSGGTCDGNRLAANGLITLDTMGPVGGEIHSPQEYLLLDSLVPRASLAALLLLKVASGEYGCSSR
ncbi:MAG: hydrolase [Phycisphaerae bacterium]|nr:hydrolase [Phycisphaerae bacterium]